MLSLKFNILSKLFCSLRQNADTIGLSLAIGVHEYTKNTTPLKSNWGMIFHLCPVQYHKMASEDSVLVPVSPRLAPKASV